MDDDKTSTEALPDPVTMEPAGAPPPTDAGAPETPAAGEVGMAALGTAETDAESLDPATWPNSAPSESAPAETSSGIPEPSQPMVATPPFHEPTLEDAVRTIAAEYSETTAADDDPSGTRNWAMLAHFSGLFFSVLGPAAILALKQDAGEFVADQTKEALNFQLSVLLAGMAATAITVATLGCGSILFIPLGIADLVYSVLAATKAGDGVRYRYPYTLRLIK